MSLFSLAELETAADLVHAVVTPTAQHAWPQLARRVGCEVWVKHENHAPTGAFKIRGGLIYMEALKRSGTPVTGVTSATRGNHGQSIAMAAARSGLKSVIYVPRGNSPAKNRAMEAFGAELIVHGRDFDEARAECARVAVERGLHFVPSFHPDLVKGVATYALELLRAVPGLDTIYVAVGMGSGIVGLISARDLLGLKTKIVGVVAHKAPSVSLSFDARRPVGTPSALTFADGMACRDPNADAIDIIVKGAERIVRVTEDEIAEAVRIYYEDTHNLAEGAGAAPLAALMQERAAMTGRRVAVILGGGNIDGEVFATILAGGTPAVS